MATTVTDLSPAQWAVSLVGLCTVWVCTAPWVHVCLSMGVYAVCVNISVNTYYYFFFLFFFFFKLSGIVDCLTVRDGVWCQSAAQNTKWSMEQCLNVSMLRFFGFVCLFLTIVGFYFFLCVLLYQLMRSPPGLWDPVERSSRISSPGCRHYKLNPNREFISEKMLSGIF